MTPDTQLAPAQVTAQSPKSSARYLPHIVRVLMGLMFFVFGLNGFLNFIPPPKAPMPEGAVAFSGALMKTGYMFPFIMGTQLLVGVLLLLNRFVPLALVLIMPVLLNIIAFHIFLQPAGIAPGAVLMVLELYLAWVYRKAYCPMLTPRATPNA
jgi:uncharacterized membrane protein YphA (DoxX/SURF4 family)